MPWITMLRGKLRANGCQGGRYSFGPREMEPPEPAYFETLSFWNGIYWTYLECRFERLCAWSVQQQVIPCGCRATSKAPESPKCSLDLTRQQWKMIIFKLHDTSWHSENSLMLFGAKLGSIWSVQVLLLAVRYGSRLDLHHHWANLGFFGRWSRTVQLQASESLTIGEWLATPNPLKIKIKKGAYFEITSFSLLR